MVLLDEFKIELEVCRLLVMCIPIVKSSTRDVYVFLGYRLDA